jgi:hypothetical protein
MKNTVITGIIAATILIAGSSSSIAQTQERAIVTKAKSIVLPEFKLDAVPFIEATRQLNAASKQHDPEHKGVSFLVMDGAETNAHANISLDLKDVTLMETTERLAENAGVFVTAADFGFIFRPKTDLGAVELVVGKWAQFDLGAGKRCRVIATQLLPDAIHLKVEILSPFTDGKDIIQSLCEITTPLGKQCDIRLGEDTMVSMIPRLKTPWPFRCRGSRRESAVAQLSTLGRDAASDYDCRFFKNRGWRF